jgi:DNA helicase HerA-like ATPase
LTEEEAKRGIPEAPLATEPPENSTTTEEKKEGEGEDEGEIIGKTSATERTPNTVDDFRFWLRAGKLLNPFDFVTVEHERGTRTIAVAREMELLTDAYSHLSNFVSSNFGDVAEFPNTLRVGTTVVTASVMANTGFKLHDRPDDVEVSLPIGSDKRVRFATASEIMFALGIHNMKNRVPAGIIEMSNGTQVPVSINRDYLLGPEGAHINASGTSGLATKTSYLMFLIQALYQRLRDNISVILFNVKQHDLLHVHEPPTDLSERDLRIYRSLDLEAGPFPEKDVHYFLPRGARGKPNSEYTPPNHQVYAYEYQYAKDHLDLLFSEISDPQGTIESIVGYIRDSSELLQTSRDNEELPAGSRVKNWSDLRNFDSYPEKVVTHHYSLLRFQRHLTRMTRGNPLFPDAAGEAVNLGDEIAALKRGAVYVIDMARISATEEQAFIVGDVMSRLEEAYLSNDESRPDKVIMLVDELNRYVPSHEKLSTVAEQLIEVARTGRSRGVVLFGAEQFKSAVNRQVTENCATHVVGRTGSQELEESAYRFLDKNTRASVSRLGKGELVLAHPLFRQPVRVVFPRPAYRRQETQ